MSKTKTKILVLVNHYTPGYKFGGPIKSVQAITAKIGKFSNFSILTSDRDLGDNEPYANIEFNKWSVGEERKYYFHGSQVSFIRTLLKEAKDYDVIYLNSFFNPVYSIYIVLLKYLGLLKNKIIVAPRGEFNPGALSLKYKKKSVFIKIAKFFSFYKGVAWHATTDIEFEATKHIFGKNANVMLAEDMSPQIVHYELAKNNKTVNSLKLIFLARVVKIKNLYFLLEVLSELRLKEGEVLLEIFGPLEDANYWRKCETLISQINLNTPYVTVNYMGELTFDKVKSTLPKYDFFVLPTLGENFGHSIADALSVGVPVIISQNTPWKDLVEKGVGWDLPLEKKAFLDILLRCIEIDNETYSEFIKNALRFSESFLNDPLLIKRYQDLFNQ